MILSYYELVIIQAIKVLRRNFYCFER